MTKPDRGQDDVLSTLSQADCQFRPQCEVMLSASATSAPLDTSEAPPTQSASDDVARMRPLTRNTPFGRALGGGLFLPQSDG